MIAPVTPETHPSEFRPAQPARSRPPAGRTIVLRLWLAAARLARWRALSLLLVVSTSLLVTWLAVFRLPVEVPTVHDEFSYLLAADTFLHGRVTNPSPPLWEHFESFHIIVRPTYMSKYPPGQALAIAAGQLLFGRPIAGVWLALALAAAVTWWALRAWVSRVWALAGGVMAAAHPLSAEWSRVYFDGSMGYLGGAVVLGAMRRVMRPDPAATRRRDAVVLAIGVLILANTRMYEGAVLCLGVGLVMLWWAAGVVRRGGATAAWQIARRLVAPAAVTLSIGAAAMLYYNDRVTGNPLQLPYVVAEQQYSVPPSFLWQKLRPMPVYNNPQLREFWTTGYSMDSYTGPRAPGALPGALAHKARSYLSWYVSPLVVVVLLLAAAWRMRRDPWTRAAWLLVALTGLGLLPATYFWPRYASPILATGILLAVLGGQEMLRWRWRGARVGVAALGMTAVIYAVTLPPILRATRYNADSRRPWALRRAEIARELVAEGGRHLIVVRYRPDHDVHAEWVYNGADLEGAPVVWAREMDAPRNARLLAYYRGRRAWLLEADAAEPRLVPYPAAPAVTALAPAATPDAAPAALR